jgi:hypothetical protein
MLKTFVVALGATAILGFAMPAFGAELGVHNEGACSSANHAGVDNVAKFSNWLGRKPDRVIDFIWFQNWSDFERSATLLTKCWRDAGYSNVTFSVPMLPKDGGATLQLGAKGAYDDHFRALAQTLVQNGYQNAILRIGWEFNIPGWPWSAYQDPKNYVKMWRRIVNVMRSVPGQNFKFDWCPALELIENGNGRVPPPKVYPGDKFVDYIGLDVYDKWFGPVNASFDERWNTWMTYKYGLAWQRDFAAAHGKQMSFPEWGTGTRPDGHGGGDDAAFVHRMADWIRQNNVVYSDYWDEHAKDYDANLSDGTQPKAGEAFRQEFGSR